jgi:thiamine-monophosphate kinase
VAEFSLIERYCTNIGVSHSATQIGVGDDAAVIQIPPGKELVISVDTMVEGVHFSSGTSASLIASKLIAVNLSDMAAMGAQPKWVTLALTLPSVDDLWLEQFANTLDSLARAYRVQLIGGDTTQGALTLSMQIMGLVNKGEAITRSNSNSGDDLYVSGPIGDAGLALAALQGQVSLSESALKTLRKRLDTPTPQVALGLQLVGVATACIDISDGLFADLTHLAESSGVTAHLNLDRIPLSKEYNAYLDGGGSLDIALTGGDDYQLGFTAPLTQRPRLIAIADELNISLARIGSVSKLTNSSVQMQYRGKPYSIKFGAGYQHFC